jgi:hypothetical protein
MHPDTRQPYRWPCGSIGEIRHDDLPFISAGETRLLVEDIVELLAAEHGYRRKEEPKTKAKAGNGSDGADWTGFLGNLIDHDEMAAFAMSLLRSGMNDGAAVNFLRAAVAGLKDVNEDRRQRRLAEIPDMASSARAKIEADHRSDRRSPCRKMPILANGTPATIPGRSRCGHGCWPISSVAASSRRSSARAAWARHRRGCCSSYRWHWGGVCAGSTFSVAAGSC